MLDMFRYGLIQKSISSILITCLLSTSTAALAAGGAQSNVNEGQSAGMGFLGGAQTLPNVSDGTSTLGNTSDNTNLFLGDFMPGVTGAPDNSTMEALADNPEGLVASGMVLRTVQKEQGCRTTTLTRRVTAKTVNKIIAVWRDENGIESPATFSGPVRVSFPTLGIETRSEQILQIGTATTPSLVLKYEHTPFQYPANKFFTYSPYIVGNVAGSFTSIGSPSNNFTFQGSFTATNANVIEIKADLFEVTRTFVIQGGACPADPVTTCVHQGINICHPATKSLADYFARKEEKGETDFGVIGLELSRLAANAKDPDADAIGDAAAATLDGATPEYAELFSGCTKTETTEQTTIEQHVEQMVACQSYWAPQGNCEQQRHITAVKTGHSAPVKTSLSYVTRGGSATIPPAAYNVRAIVKLFSLSVKQSILDEISEVQYFNTGDVGIVYLSPYETGYLADWGTTPGKTFWYPRIISADSGGLEFISHGSPANNWTPTISMRVGANFSIVYEEYLITSDVVESSGSESCDFISREIQDGRCPGLASASTCSVTNQDGFINSTIPMSGAEAGIGVLAGAHPSMPPNCMVSSANPNACLPANLLSEYLTNIQPPSWRDNCHVKGKLVHPGGIVGAGSACVRKPEMDACIEGGATTGTCYAKEMFFDCGNDKSRPVTSEVHVQEVCGSPIRCLGTECANTVGESNGDLGMAMAAGNMVEAMSQDMMCEETGQPPTGPYDTCTVRVFTGEKRECRIPAVAGGGIASDCCEEGLSGAASQGMSPILAVKAWNATKKLATNDQFTGMLSKLPGSSFVEGAWNATKAVVQTITDPITSFVAKLGQKVVGDPTMAFAKLGLGGAGAAGGQTFTVKIMQMTYNFLDAIGMDEIAGKLFATTTEGVGEEAVTSVQGLNPMVTSLMNFLNAVMIAYAVLQVIGQLLYGCDEEEYALGMERTKKNCHAVGGYCSKEFPSELGGGCEIRSQAFCCYMSPLNRIIAEQMRMQLGGYGPASDPNCNGFTLDEVNAFDWSALDMSEWEDLLREAGIMPETPDEAEQMWGMETDRGIITANGPSFGPDGPVTPVQLVEDRLANSEAKFEGARNELSDDVACSYNGGVQWYGTPTEGTDQAVVDVYVVKKQFSVLAQGYYDGCPSGSDGEFRANVYPDVTFDIFTDSVRSSNVTRYCDGMLHSIVPSQGATLTGTTIQLNGDEIDSLPENLVATGKCKPAPAAESIGSEWYATTFANGAQQLLPDCVSTNNKRITWVQDKGIAWYNQTLNIEIMYQFRIRSTEVVESPKIQSNCINPLTE